MSQGHRPEEEDLKSATTLDLGSQGIIRVDHGLRTTSFTVFTFSGAYSFNLNEYALKALQEALQR